MDSEKILVWVDKHLVSLLISVCIFRVGFLLVNDIGLFGDESYYWDWSRQPDWCYYSKPPMVAWMIGISTGLMGDNIAAVRFPAVMFGTVTLWFLHATARAFFGWRAAALALLLILATPGNVLANLIMTIDAPLCCFWVMSLYYLRRAIFDQVPWAWLWSGCSVAAALLSKQVAITIPLMLLLFIFLDRRRYVLLKKEFLIFLLPIIVAVIPVLIWNQQHEWVMFDHSKSHFTSTSAQTVAQVFKHVWELLFYQTLLISPVTFALSLMVTAQSLYGFKRIGPEQQFLVLMGPAMLFLMLMLSVEQKVQGNWPIPFYFSTFILLSGLWDGRWKKTVKFGLMLGFLMVGLTYLLPMLLQAFNLKYSVFDPARRFNHWPELAQTIQNERQVALPGLDNTFVVALGHRNLASQLAFYLPDHPKVYRYERSGEVRSQYEIWPGPDEFVGSNALLISDSEDGVPDEIRNAFQKFSFLNEIANPMHPESPFYLYLGEQLKKWPPTLGQPEFQEN